MATQRELIEGFVLENSNVTVASNMRRFGSEDNETVEYLCGGRNGEEAVIAKREPLNQITIFYRAPYGTRMYSGNINDQMYKTRRVAQNLEETNDIAVDLIRESREIDEMPVDI